MKKFLPLLIVVLGIAGWLVWREVHPPIVSNEFSGVITGFVGDVITMKGVYTIAGSSQEPRDKQSRQISVRVTSNTQFVNAVYDPQTKIVMKSVTADDLKMYIEKNKFVLAKIYSADNIYLKTSVSPDKIVYTADNPSGI